jgi:hypothetical protein
MGKLLTWNDGGRPWIMRQAFSLRDCVDRRSRALPWASMREAVGLQEPVAEPAFAQGYGTGTRHRSLVRTTDVPLAHASG